MAKNLLKDFRISGDVIDQVADSPRPALQETTSPPQSNSGTTGPESRLQDGADPGPPTGATHLPDDERGSLTIVGEFYQKELTTNREAQTYLEGLGLLDWEVLKRLGAGYSVGALVPILSEDQKKALTRLGVLDAGGAEALAGCVVVPTTDEAGRVTGFWGQRTTGGKDLVLGRGLVNRDALKVWREETVLTGLMEALRLLTQGFERVLPCCLPQGFTDDHLGALKNAGVKKVVIGFDVPGLKDRLVAEGFAVAVVDVVGLSRRGGLDRERLEDAINAAPVVVPETKSQWAFHKTTGRWELENAGLSYKVMGSKERPSASLRLSVRIEKAGKRFIDHVDLYSARSRSGFKESAAAVLAAEAALIEQDLLGLLDQIEAAQDEDEKPAEVKMTEAERELGMSLLTSPRLLDDVVTDMEILGHVGEEVNKKLVYLAASSRKLDDPVSVVIVSQSAAGKSFLIDTVRLLMPPEGVVNLTSLSDQALNYIPEGGLVNKLLILGEAVHNEVVEHQIREMLSAKELSRMVVTKDERTGKLASKVVRQKALVSLMMSTTSHEMNPENASRSFFIHADESEEQTKRIHQQQNKKYTLEEMRRRRELAPAVIAKHQAAQRLLRPVVIVNPFAGGTGTLGIDAPGKPFPSSLMRSRRDNKQLNELTAAVCYLRQYQKQVKKAGGLEYVECDETDVKTAWDLFTQGIMSATYLELPVSLVKLYEEIRRLCRSQAETAGLAITDVSFDQSLIRKSVRWLGNESIKKYLRKLVSLEYLVTKSGFGRGQRVRYQLASDESPAQMAGLEEQK